MPKLIVSIDGVVVKEVQLTKDRVTIGRRPYNDVVIDNLAVSGEHAVVEMTGALAMLEDLGSTNGTYVNGRVIKKQVLVHEDTIEIGKYKLKFLERESGDSQSAATGPSSVLLGMETAPRSSSDRRGPRVRVLTGKSAGRELELTKVVSTVGKPGLSVASITRKAHGFDLARVEGVHMPTVNGVALDGSPITLKHQDLIELGGIRLEFLDS
ncbi:MAG: FHA domain-containing protein [Proteobacteria bacterium]|nr:FHA domain-containing protein [Pseudomonadota bacterium]